MKLITHPNQLFKTIPIVNIANFLTEYNIE